MSYTTREAIEQRLTKPGYRFVADKDRSGHVSEGEAIAIIDDAIEWANNFVAGSISNLIDPASEKAFAVSWLRDRATDLATYRAATQGAKRVPSVLRSDFDRAVEMLTAVREGMLTVPGLPGSGPQRSQVGVVAIQATDREPCRRSRRWRY